MTESLLSQRAEQKNLQNHRLNHKLQERLDYTGVYSQRDSQRFIHRLPTAERQKILAELKTIYYEILTIYFSHNSKAIEKIDRFVETAFFVNLSFKQIVEIHLELIEELSRQLQIEGFNPDFLSDYRLVLIDVMAHLGEMYRSVIREQCFSHPE